MTGFHLVGPPTGLDRRNVVPELPAELEGAIAAMRPTRYPGVDPDDPGMVVHGQAPVHHPLAARYVLEFAALLDPASQDDIRDWLLLVGTGVGNAPTDRTDILLRHRAVIIACGNLPRAVWCQETAAEALRTLKYFPTSSEVSDLLEPHAEALRRMHRDLEAIAEAPPAARPPAPRARASSEPYAPVASTPVEPPRAVEPHAPVRSVDEQLVAMGFKPGERVVVRDVPGDPAAG
jgi:hypothetical protein